MKQIIVVAVLVAQSCLAVCDPTGCSPPGASVHGILQVRVLEWVAIWCLPKLNENLCLYKDGTTVTQLYLTPN